MPETKTNVMRFLDQKKVPYIPHSYPHDGGAVDGLTVASMTCQPPEKVFKTLAVRGGKGVYVFVIPVTGELDLKKAASSVGEKSVSMLHVNELLSVTGYVRGSCSPIGMKKRYRTVIDTSALAQETILVSAGKIGAQVELSPRDLLALCAAEAADLTTEE